MIVGLIVQSILVISAASIVYVDAVVFAHGTSENSLTEYTQEGIVLISAIIFFTLSRLRPESRGFLIIFGGFFTVVLIREADALLDQIRHGFWVYPAILVTVITLFYARKFPGTVSRPFAVYFQSMPFAYITMGLLIVILFSRIIGSGTIWKVVMADNYSANYKAIIQEGVELLGYVFVFYGSVLLWIKRTAIADLSKT